MGSIEEAAVSVIIPAHHAVSTIGGAARSLIAQTWTAWEGLIVADDDVDYAAVLAAQGVEDARLRFFSTGRNGAGAPSARNVALAAARFPLIAPLDADDRYRQDRLARLAPLALARGAAFDNVRVVRDCDDTLITTLFPDPPDGTALSEIDGERFVATSIPMFPVVRRALCPPWSEDVDFCDDVVFNIQILDRVGEAPLSLQPTYEYRQRKGSITFAADSGARADRCYRHVLMRLDGDGLGMSNPGLRSLFAEALAGKRARNAAFEAARTAGRCANFQEFIALAG